MRLILSPHASNWDKNFHEAIDIQSANEFEYPWAVVHIDMFAGDDEIYQALYHRGEAITVELTIVNPD